MEESDLESGLLLSNPFMPHEVDEESKSKRMQQRLCIEGEKFEWNSDSLPQKGDDSHQPIQQILPDSAPIFDRKTRSTLVNTHKIMRKQKEKGAFSCKDL